MNGTEKRINEIKFRVEDSVLLTLSKLATLDDRTLTDYVHHAVMLHVNGHGFRLDAACESSNKTSRGQ